MRYDAHIILRQRWAANRQAACGIKARDFVRTKTNAAGDPVPSWANHGAHSPMVVSSLDLGRAAPFRVLPAPLSREGRE